MARTRVTTKAPPAPRPTHDDPRVTRHDVPSRPLMTIKPESPIWASGKAVRVATPLALKGAMVRIQPPADATPDRIESVRATVAAVALGVRVMPKAAGHVAQAPATSPEKPADAQGSASIRQRALRRAEALQGARDVSALKTAVDQSLTAAGL